MADLSFGEWLKRQRGAQGWTQKELAQRLNCSLSALRKMETEERHPSGQVIERLAEIFNIPNDGRKSFLRFARGDWQALSSRETEDSPWRVLHNTPRSNLPASITSFIGRDKELDEVTHLVSNNRLVTLAGVGGIGKTRLAIQVGQKLLSDYPNGVWFISLDSLSDPALLTQTVAAIFDIREGSSDRPLIERLTYSLSAKTTLLIFDNCEHLLDACAQLITTLLTNCPNLKVLATSRQTLNITGEAICSMPSLSIPENDNASIEKLAEYESIRLFTDRASLAITSFILTKENAQAVIDICRKVDGIPLALELAAARVNILQVKEILKQLQNSFALLSSDGQTTLPRQRTLQASMDWSWELLSETEQTLLRRLSVFAGGWTLEGAQAICQNNALGLMTALVKKSLVAVEQEMNHATRYRFHNIIHQYVYEELIKSGEEEDLRTQHLNFYLEFSKAAESGLRGSKQKTWHILLEDERDNVRAALEWAEKTNLEAGLYLSGRLQGFWESLDVYEGLVWMTKFLNKPQSKEYPLARAKALCTQAMLMVWTQQEAEAQAAARESLNLYKAHKDVVGELDALIMLATSVTHWNEEVIELFQKALHLSKLIGDEWRQAILFRLASSGDEYFPHIAPPEETVPLFQRVGDLELTVEYMFSLGKLELLHDQPVRAQKWVDDAIRICHASGLIRQTQENSQVEAIILLSQQLKNKTWLAFILQLYARIAFANGNIGEAFSGLSKSIELGYELGHRMVYLWSLTHLGYFKLDQGAIKQAREIFIETGQSFLRDQNIIGVVFSLEGMAGIYVTTGEYRNAIRLIGWADAARKKINDPRPVIEQNLVDKIIAACMTNMGKEAYSNVYNEGQAMSLDTVVHVALQDH